MVCDQCNRKGRFSLPSLVILVEANLLLLYVNMMVRTFWCCQSTCLYAHPSLASSDWKVRCLVRYVCSFLPNQKKNKNLFRLKFCSICRLGCSIQGKDFIWTLYYAMADNARFFQAIKTLMEPVPQLAVGSRSCSAAVDYLLITWLYRI